MQWSTVGGCLVLRGMLHFRCEFGYSVLFAFVVSLSDVSVLLLVKDSVQHCYFIWFGLCFLICLFQIPTSFIYRRNEQDQRRGRGSGVLLTMMELRVISYHRDRMAVQPLTMAMWAVLRMFQGLYSH